MKSNKRRKQQRNAEAVSKLKAKKALKKQLKRRNAKLAEGWENVKTKIENGKIVISVRS